MTEAVRKRNRRSGTEARFRCVLILAAAWTLPLSVSMPGLEMSASAQQAPEQVRVGVLANSGTERCAEKWGPTAEYLTDVIPGFTFAIAPLGFDEVDSAVESNEVDFVLTNSSYYVGLEKHHGVNRIATLKNRRTAGVFTVLGGVIFCRDDRDDIQSLGDLRGRTFRGVDEESLGGWHAAWRELDRAGIAPRRDLRSLTFGGSHEAVVFAVRDGEVDAGTVRTDTLERMAAEGTIRLEDFRALEHEHGAGVVCESSFLHSTDVYPEWPMAKLVRTSDDLAEQVAVALISMPPDCSAAVAAQCAGWTVPLNYQPVHDCLKELRVDPYEGYGNVTLGQAIRQHWSSGLAALGIVGAAFGVYAVWSSRRVLASAEAVRESQERLRAQNDSLPLPVYTWDKVGDDFVVASANTTAVKLTEGKVVSLYGKRASEIWQDSPDLIEDMHRCYREQRVIRRERSYTFVSTGETQYLDITFGFMPPSSVTVFTEDISERKTAEERLEKSERKFRGLFNNARIGLFRTRLPDGLFVDANQRLASMFGYDSPDELVGRLKVADYYADVDGRAEMTAELTGTGKVDNRETRFTKKDGSVWWSRYSGNLSEDGQYFEGVAADITEHKRAEEALVHRAQFEALMSGISSDLVGLTAHETDEGMDRALSSIGAFTRVDRAYVFLMRDEGARMDYAHEWCAEGVKPQIANIGDLPAEAFPWWMARLRRFEHVHVPRVADLPPEASAEKETLQAQDIESVLVVPLALGDTLLGFVGFDSVREERTWSQADIALLRTTAEIITNALNRKRAEESREEMEAQLRQAQRMEAVGQLAGGVAHDFNNLLQAILGYADMALEEPAAEGLVKDDLEEIMKAGKRAATLVSQLLAFSRQQVLDMRDVDLNVVIADVMKMIRRVIGEHIALDARFARDLGTVHADRGQLEQILMNLCVNARDAMADGGKITIETENVRIDEAFCETHPWAEPGHYANLSVTDTGCGMDEETLGNVFEPFFTTKGVGEGTGLGLSTVYGLVKQHRGMIHVYSEVDAGTVFKVYLPLVDRATVAAGDRPEGPVAGGNETVLLAEDEEIVRRLTNTILTRAGYTVLNARDGEEALRVFEDHADEIGLALLDVMMPKLGGRAVYERIREARPGIRVLFSSGYSMNAIHTDFVLDEGLALISKPFQHNELLRRVREALDSRNDAAESSSTDA
ncbi:MAG: PhnD/SsuA/transferrin family substrate-binding protein [bacterium]|nr:PhnD/SsuA/transferrin family substrate-binding protein [bacterium]